MSHASSNLIDYKRYAIDQKGPMRDALLEGVRADL